MTIDEFKKSIADEFKKSIEVVEDEENMNINFMNKGDKFPWSDLEKEKIVFEIEKLLDKFYDKDNVEYNYTYEGIKKYVNLSNENKQWMEATLAKHPKYDPATHTIRLTKKFSRMQNMDEVKNFCDFLSDRIRVKIGEDNKISKPINFNRRDEIKNQKVKIDSIIYAFSNFEFPGFAEYLGHDFAYWQERQDSITKEYKDIVEYEQGYRLDVNNEEVIVPCKPFHEYIEVKRIIDSIYFEKGFEEEGRITSRFVRYVENRSSVNGINFLDIIHPVEGQKVSTIIKKIAMYYGVDKYTEEKTIEWTDSNTGEVKSKIKNVGWNYRFTQFCDKIKPFEKEMQVVISLNPIDYLTMSFGYGWASCQTIDKTNERDNDNNYEGCYSGGTTELGEDESTIVVYLLDADDKTETPYLSDKIKRCLFFMGEDKFVESRVYPDGRDGSDYTDVSKRLREIMEEVLEECNNIEKKGDWEEKPKDGGVKDLYINDCIINAYHDFREYSDIYSVRRKGFNKIEPIKLIKVGGTCTCLSCGGSNYRAESIICEDCYEGELDGGIGICENCGERIDEDDNYQYIDGEYYCCSECAESAGYRWCDYIEDWRYRDDVFYDEYYNEYYLFDDGIEMDNGEYFYDEESAENCGYHYCDCCSSWVYDDNWNSELNCCTNCEDEVLEQMKEEEVA